MTLTIDTKRGSDFAVLNRRIRAEGLLERRYGHYLFRITTTLAAFAAAWVVFAALGNTWWQLVTAGVLGLLFTQVAFLGHDGGHQQIWRNRTTNDMFTVVLGNLLTGLSFGWWVDKHNRHHANPNHEDHDPDIGDGVLAFTAEHISNRHDKSIGRFFAAHQAALFFPLLTLEGLNLHVSSVRYLMQAPTSRSGRYRTIEIVLFTIHCVAYVAALLLVLSPLLALAFAAVHLAVFGVYMGCSFAPNHKGMPTIPTGVKIDFLRRQVLTSRNVRGGWFTDFLLGGLNYQVEHHLFPNMPRCNLGRAQKIVRAHCDEQGICYTETSLLGSYAIVLRHLHDLGTPLRQGTVVTT